ncbi:MAG TPA: hypothetical protein VG890_06900 [Puia sp.]|nr:hypothetical protein [Puia sp.]
MSNDFFYRRSMHWLSQIQSIRNEVERIKPEFRTWSLVQKDSPKRKQSLLEEAWQLDELLNATEALLLASLNNGTIYWAGHHQTYDTPKIDPRENELFDRMKNIYDTYIELLRSATVLLSAQEAEEVA